MGVKVEFEDEAVAAVEPKPKEKFDVSCDIKESIDITEVVSVL
jgi:hypothetical protein